MALQKQPAAESKTCSCIPLHVCATVTGTMAEPKKSIENSNIWGWGFCSFCSFKPQAEGRGSSSTQQGDVLLGAHCPLSAPRGDCQKP